MLFNTYEISSSHLSRSTDIIVVDCCQFGTTRIWNTSEPSELHLSRATAISVVEYCQLGPSWMFRLKIEIMACAGLIGETMEQSCRFPDLIW